MTALFRSSVRTLVVTACLSASAAARQGTPGWPLHRADAQNSGRSTARGGLGRQVWVRDLGAPVHCAPVIGPNGAVFVAATDGTVHALDGATGSTLWRHDTGAVLRASPALGPAGSLFVGGPSGSLLILDAASGELVRRVTSPRVLSQGGASTEGPPPATAAAREVEVAPRPLAGTRLVLHQPHRGWLSAVDTRSGSALWNVPGVPHRLAIAHGAATIYAAGTVTLSDDRTPAERVVALSAATGRTLWSVALGRRAVGAYDPVRVAVTCRGEPVVAADGTVLVGGDARDRLAGGGPPVGEPRLPAAMLFAVDPVARRVRWVYRGAEGIALAPAVASDGTVLFAVSSARGSRVAALDGRTGALVWQADTGTAHVTAPVVDAAGVVYVGTGHELRALSGQSGATVWVLDTGDWVLDPAIGLDGTLYAASGTRILAVR